MKKKEPASVKIEAAESKALLPPKAGAEEAENAAPKEPAPAENTGENGFPAESLPGPDAAEASVTPGRVLEELAAIAFCRATDYVCVQEGRALVRDTGTLSDAAARAIVSIKESTRGVEVKLGDKLRALELLGRSVGLFDRDEADTAGPVPLILDDIPEAEEDE